MRTYSAAAWLMMISAVFSIYIGLYHYPPVHDTWGHIHDKAWYARPLLEIFKFNYFHDNPRIGQTLLMVFGGTPGGRALFGTISVTLLIYTSFILIAGRTPSLVFADAVLLLWIIFSLLTVGAMPGQMIFYIPYNANYILGLALLFAFVVPYRLDLDGKRLPTAPMCSIMGVLGLAAGLSNEHTVPTALALLPLIALNARYGVGCSRSEMYRRKEENGWLWKLVGYTALFVGYVSLYFAPGQNTRYGEGAKSSGFAHLASSFVERVSSATEMLLQGSTPLLLGIVAVATILVGINRLNIRENYAPCISISILAAFSISVTTLASPLIAPRLMFAGGYILALTCGAILWTALVKRPKSMSLFGALIGVIVAAVSVANWLSINRFAAAFADRTRQVELQLAQGASLVKVRPYDLESLGSPSVIHLDDESNRPEPPRVCRRLQLPNRMEP